MILYEEGREQGVVEEDFGPFLYMDCSPLGRHHGNMPFMSDLCFLEFMFRCHVSVIHGISFSLSAYGEPYPTQCS